MRKKNDLSQEKKRMSGWRHFGLRMNGASEEAMKIKRILKFSGTRPGEESEEKDSFHCVYRPGYGHNDDKDLIVQLKNSSERGYYVEANNTTDIGWGVIRFKKNESFIATTELVDDSIEWDDREIDGRRSRLPVFQFNSPEYWLIYELLSSEGFPVIKSPR